MGGYQRWSIAERRGQTKCYEYFRFLSWSPTEILPWSGQLARPAWTSVNWPRLVSCRRHQASWPGYLYQIRSLAGFHKASTVSIHSNQHLLQNFCQHISLIQLPSFSSRWMFTSIASQRCHHYPTFQIFRVADQCYQQRVWPRRSERPHNIQTLPKRLWYTRVSSTGC